ncbi:acyltransferase family protein [Streptomyces sp. NPDC059443]|uniref:acyltransferase family protein n=1 Tax=unclassified Streptomyces TaxID=2593676 RepID=UPI00367AB3CF
MSGVTPAVPVTTPAPTARLLSLTGMRWAAALLVFCFHVTVETGFFGEARDKETLARLFGGGASGVSFFFVLSGFVLTWSARSHDSKVAFWRRRFARIYPSHFVMFLAAVAYLMWTGAELSGRVAAANLTLTQSWAVLGPDYWYGYNGVSWSLSVEFFFYFTFPFIVPVIVRMGVRGWWAIVVVCTGLVVAMPYLMEPVAEKTGIRELYFVYLCPPVRLLEFAVGIALALLVKSGRWHGPNMTLSSVVFLAGLLLNKTIAAETSQWLVAGAAVGVIGCVLMIPAAARADIRGTASIWRHPRMVWLGEVSFCFYLVHELVLYSTVYLFHGAPRLRTVQATALMFACFSVALILAVLVHELVEKPFVKRLSPKSKRRGRGSAVPPQGDRRGTEPLVGANG